MSQINRQSFTSLRVLVPCLDHLARGQEVALRRADDPRAPVFVASVWCRRDQELELVIGCPEDIDEDLVTVRVDLRERTIRRADMEFDPLVQRLLAERYEVSGRPRAVA